MFNKLKYFFKREFEIELLAGIWYGINSYSDGSSMMTCSSYEEDGTAEVHFKQKFEDRSPYEAIEEGTWLVEKKFLIKTMKDQYGIVKENKYKIISLSENQLEYQSLNSGHTGTIYKQERSTTELDEKWKSFVPTSNNVPRPPKPRSTERPEFPIFDSCVDFNDPNAITRAFIKDYETWNSFANKLDDDNIVLDYAKEAYESFVRQYCIDEVVAQNIAFGARSSHRLDHEEIVATEVNDEHSIVKTKHEKDLGGCIFEDIYEYHYEKTENGWRLNSLLVVFEDGKVECI